MRGVEAVGEASVVAARADVSRIIGVVYILNRLRMID